MSPIYESMKDWVVDRQTAKVKAEAPDLSPDMRIAAERYCEWLDDQKPDWLNDIERPGDGGAA